jgi:hypothetical protein
MVAGGQSLCALVPGLGALAELGFYTNLISTLALCTSGALLGFEIGSRWLQSENERRLESDTGAVPRRMTWAGSFLSGFAIVGACGLHILLIVVLAATISETIAILLSIFLCLLTPSLASAALQCIQDRAVEGQIARGLALITTGVCFLIACLEGDWTLFFALGLMFGVLAMGLYAFALPGAFYVRSTQRWQEKYTLELPQAKVVTKVVQPDSQALSTLQL